MKIYKYNKKKSKEYYEDNKERIKEYQRKYRIKNKEKILLWKNKNKEHLSKYGKRYNQINNIRKAELQRDWSKRNPKKIIAQNRAKYHIPIGNKCDICGKEGNLERHHPDYLKPFKIITVCKSCHLRIHKK